MNSSVFFRVFCMPMVKLVLVTGLLLVSAHVIANKNLPGKVNQVTPCDAINITTDDYQLTIAHLTAPIVMIQISNHTWSTTFKQIYYNLSDYTVALNSLTTDIYWVRINMFTADWQPICEKSGFFDVPGEVNLNWLDVEDLRITEVAGLATVRICLPQAWHLSVAVDYSITSESAAAGIDYVVSSGQLLIQPGQECIILNIPIINDTVTEVDESFLVTLSNPVNARIGDGLGVVTITDDESCLPTICFGNICPSQTANLNDAYSIPRLPSGTFVTWHTEPIATSLNRLTPEQAASITIDFNTYYFYASIYNSANDCYSSTVPVFILMNTCNEPTFFPTPAINTSGGRNPSILSKGESVARKVTITPNPFKNGLQVSIESNKDERITLSLIDLLGRHLKSQTVQLKPGKNQITFESLSMLPQGNYYFRIVSKNSVESYKIIK